MESSNHKPVGLQRKCSFIHSFPTSVYRICSCAFVLTAVRVYPCARQMSTAQWLVCEVTDSFIMARAYRETAPCRGRRAEDRQGTGQGYCWAGPRQSSSWGGWVRTAAVSFNEPSLLSSAFNVQSCPALAPSNP